MNPEAEQAMEFGPKRGHFLFIFENFFKDFSLLIIALAVGLIKGDMDFVLENAGVLIVVLIGPIGRISRFFTTYYSVDQERLIVKSGLFLKNNLEVPLSTITTVDFSQSILHQIFGVYRLNIDNASNVSAVNTKLNMTLRREDAFQVRSLLIRGRDGLDGFNAAADTAQAVGAEKASDPEDAAGTAAAGPAGSTNSSSCSDSTNTAGAVFSSAGSPSASTEHKKHIRIKSSDLILMGLLKSKGAFFAQLIAIVTTILAVFNVSKDSAAVLTETALAFISVTGFAGFIAFAAGLIFLISLLCGMAGSLIRYYGFTITDNGVAVKIEYGFFTKKRYTIQKNRVSGFLYQQSFLMKCFKTGTLQLFAIGYGQSGDDSSSEEPILFPLIEAAKVRTAMSEILPEMEEVSDYQKAAKGSVRYFFYGVGFILALIFLAGSVYASFRLPHCGYLWTAGVLILFYSIAGRIQEYKNAGIYGNDSNMSLSYGGFKKSTVFVKTSHVESVSAKAGRLKAKKGIVSITLSYIAPILSTNKVAQNVPVSCFDAIKEKLIY